MIIIPRTDQLAGMLDTMIHVKRRKRDCSALAKKKDITGERGGKPPYRENCHHRYLSLCRSRSL